MESVKVERVYNAPVEAVWKAITDKAEMRNWYFDFSEDWKLEVGHEWDWWAGPPDGEKWHHRGKMLEIIPNKKLSHTWEYPGYSGTSIVTWELFAEGEKTKLVLTHVFNVPFDKNVDALKRENFAEGWNQLVNIALADHLEKDDQ
jgi:uncharacterized protein YndB with AHSA1/START domain